MAIKVDCQLPKALCEPVAQAISDAVGQHEGKWRATVSEVEGRDAWDVRIEGENNFTWTHRFEGLERDATIVSNSIRIAVEMAAGDLSIALAELVRQGITFTTETRADGGTDYMIDRLILKDVEVADLARQGNLTREGIRSYLVNR
jgi:hypothetical protein